MCSVLIFHKYVLRNFVPHRFVIHNFHNILAYTLKLFGTKYFNEHLLKIMSYLRTQFSIYIHNVIRLMLHVCITSINKNIVCKRNESCKTTINTKIHAYVYMNTFNFQIHYVDVLQVISPKFMQANILNKKNNTNINRKKSTHFREKTREVRVVGRIHYQLIFI